MRLSVVAIALMVVAAIGSVARAQSYSAYHPGYKFGELGDAQHPEGYDGYPGDTPPGTVGAPSGTPPNGGPGGNGIGGARGGKGGDGAPGGNGGKGGNSPLCQRE
jgi:hypothetical protein